MCGRTYVILYFDSHVFLCSFRVQPHPKLHYAESLGLGLFTALNCFAGAVKTQQLMGAPFLFELVAVVS